MVISPGPMAKCGDVSTVETHSLYSLDKKIEILLGNRFYWETPRGV